MLTISNAIASSKLKSAFIPFITAGYPNVSVTSEVITILDQLGVHAIELGIPYTDALADGPVIQESSRIALEQNIVFSQILDLVRSSSSIINTPIIIFTYLNPILSQGIESFIKEIAKAGARGLVIPDLPIEESDYFIEICKHYQVELILFISPASPEIRIKEILRKAPGCVYLVSSYGVTGLRNSLSEGLCSLIKRVKVMTDKHVLLGFGISNASQVSEILNNEFSVDAIVMGSIIIKKISSSYMSGNYDCLKLFCEEIKIAMKNNQ